MSRSAAEKRAFKAQVRAEEEVRIQKEIHDEKVKIDNNTTIRIIAFCFLIMIVGFAAYFASYSFNPDTDSFWLIETGRWIVENKQVPKTNPWTYTEGLSIIVQQPLCAVLNYVWYAHTSGLSDMWKLAMIENVVLVIATLYLSSSFSTRNRRTVSFLSAIMVEVFFISCGLITTRPYQLTTAAMMFLVANLERAKKKDKMPLVFVSIALVTLFQANYQMASLMMILCFLLCYMVGGAVDRLRGKNRLRNERIVAWVLVYVEWLLVRLINPYGLDGASYLNKSTEAMRIVSGRILEMSAPSVISFPFIIITITLFMFFYMAIKRKNWNMTGTLLVFGSSFATCLAVRNFWMVIIAFVAMYTKMISDKKEETKNESVFRIKMEKLRLRIAEELPQSMFKIKELLLAPPKIKKEVPYFIHKVIRYAFLGGTLVFSFLILKVSSYISANTVKDIDSILSFIREEVPADSKVYTAFNTGGIMELAGRKVYIDARPELYSKEITRTENDLLKEWMDLEWNDSLSIPEYVSAHDWDYYFVAKDSVLYYYFEFSDVADCVFDNKYGTFFKIKEENKNIKHIEQIITNNDVVNGNKE